MADQPAAERTEQPTGKRLSKAKEKGKTPQSQELLSFVSILTLVAMTFFLAPGLMQWFVKLLTEGISCDRSVFANSETFTNFINTKVVDLLLLILPILIVLSAGAVFGNIAIAGLNFSPGAIRLNFDVLNPAGGLGKLVNARSMVRLLISIAKLLFVSGIVWVYLRDRFDVLAALRWTWSLQMLAAITKIILGLMIRICIALLVIGIADTAYQKWKYIHDLKMTKQEVKEERKQTEGPPEVKRRIRTVQLQMALKRMMQEVPKASVVLVNPTEYAVALRYDAKTMEAPLLVAKGADHLAEKIREIARAYGVPIVRKPELTRTIYSTVKTGNPIPHTLYVAVAEILAMIYRLRQRKA